MGSSKKAKFYCNADSSGSKYKWVKQLEYLPEGTGLVTESINLYYQQNYQEIYKLFNCSNLEN